MHVIVETIGLCKLAYLGFHTLGKVPMFITTCEV